MPVQRTARPLGCELIQAVARRFRAGGPRLAAFARRGDFCLNRKCPTFGIGGLSSLVPLKVSHLSLFSKGGNHEPEAEDTDTDWSRFLTMSPDGEAVLRTGMGSAILDSFLPASERISSEKISPLGEL